MSNLYRFGVSLEHSLIDKFDQHIAARNYRNRSEAIRDLIREELIKEQWTKNMKVAGAITMSYDHHQRELVHTLMEIQHDFGDVVISTQHIHLDHSNCLEILAVKGNAKNVKNLADKIRAQKGVHHVSLSMSTTGHHLK